ncbi:hypothetical protein Q1695_006699 [Nippostrongylus brasiliensis]|nr:hypothetical protein Q1695_006699 [Nippostrongylus brasiliensis]
MNPGRLGGGRMPVTGGSSRSGRLARISQSNIRPFGSGGAGGGTGPGGHPLSGPDPTSPTKKEVKHRFEITKKLGSGTYGKVSLAFDHKFDREVAVKLIKKSAIENKADLVRIRREIRIMSALHHPNIIQIYEVFENREKIILVMEYASGGELYDYVSRFGSLPESEARRIFRQITSAVLYCHKHQVAHRDLKLENILLDQDNNAKIADFGLSNYFGTKSLLTTFCGSPLYASPEIINGTPYKGPEVDCWSLGILLYTLVYGSMPFDGRDFNRMVRQIKRGAYYEPDTPSTASMLIRNMLRVNPERRADIFDIASHWWLNLEENMPVIQELPENQITDHTPLTERAETMVVQDLADETDVFMEFSHLSNETRRKIEEFRRRRKQAEEYNENSPVKPPKAARKEGEPAVEMKSEEKSLRGVKEDVKVEKDTDDPLERLRQIENRLGQQRKKSALGNVPQTVSPDKEMPAPFKPPSHQVEPAVKSPTTARQRTPEQPEDPKPAPVERTSQPEPTVSRAPSFLPVSEPETPHVPTRADIDLFRRPSGGLRTPRSAAAYRLEVDSLNMLMNQVLEQMEKGPVSLNLVARIKAHPMYDSRPMVKELLESIMDSLVAATQPEQVQRETTKLVQQQSQEVARKNQQKIGAFEPKPVATKPPEKATRQILEERPWHSVEVGFDPDEESEVEAGHQQSVASAATEVTVQTTSFEDSDDQAAHPQVILAPVALDEEEGADSEDEEDYTDSEMEDLAEEVEQKIVVEAAETLPPPDPVVVQPQYLDAFDRGLVKRQSKGKYQAKKIIMQYPGRPDLSEIEDGMIKKKKDWLKTQDPDQHAASDASITPTPSCVGSVPPRTPPPMEQGGAEAAHTESEEEEESDASSEENESSEESETEIGNRQPRGTIIGEVRRDGDKIEPKAVELVARKLSFMQSAPASIHTSPSPEPKTPTATSKYYMTMAELKKPIEPKPYTRMNSSNMTTTQATVEPKPRIQEAVAPTVVEEERPPTAVDESRLFYTNPLFRPSDANSAWLSRITTTRGKESWESAAAYIRRKNRDRRIRNRTIGSTEEALRDLDRITGGFYDEPTEAPLSPTTQGRYSPIGTDPYYSHHAAAPSSSIFTYVSPRYNEQNYRRHDDRPVTPNRFHSAAVARDDVRISEISPERLDYRVTGYGGGADTHSYYTSNASPSYSRKLNENQSWASEPRRFEVYKTRAERDAERNVNAAISNSTSYRPASYYSSASDRPLNNFAVRKPEDLLKFDPYRPAVDPYRTRLDDYSYRRMPYEFEKSAMSGTDHATQSTATAPDNAASNRFRPTTRRLIKNDGERPSYTRTRSMDRKQGLGEDYDYGAQLRNRLLTPEPAVDYSYVNYHDTSNGRASATKDEKGQPRSILKNKQSVELEQRNGGVMAAADDVAAMAAGRQGDASGNGAVGGGAGVGPVRSEVGLPPNSRNTHEVKLVIRSEKRRSILSEFLQIFGNMALKKRNGENNTAESEGATHHKLKIVEVIDRLRRHLSLEKSSSPQRQTAAQPSMLSAGTRIAPLTSNSRDTQDRIAEDSPKKKRSILPFNRRRTSEVRMGSDGKIMTNGFDDNNSHTKRPSSPIEKIKSLFRKNEPSSSALPSSDFYSGRYAGSAASDKVYGGYQSANVPSTREAYVPQYRKYPGSTTRDPASVLNRYSYTSGLTDQRRHWFDDHNIY